jgi:formylglycine-generating enzyme required for sulfatase activity
MNRLHLLRHLLVTLATAPLLAMGADLSPGDTFKDAMRTGGQGPEMVVITGGIFVLGGGSPGQQDVGKVKIDYRLAFSTKEITNGEYRIFLEANQSGGLREFPKDQDNLPVSGVNFDEAEAYMSWLSRTTGHHYRLPSASEWEYAARAGTTTMYFWGDEVGDGQANCMNCSGGANGKIMPVGSFKPNAWGLYDMHGNVWEWTKDCIDANTAPPANGMPILFGNCDSRELRGGSARSDALSIRAGARASARRIQQLEDVGFRAVRVISAPPP